VKKLIFGGTALLLALLGWLMWPSAAGGTTLHTGTADTLVTVVVDSPRVGDTGLTISLTGRDGRPVTGAFVQVEAVMPLMGWATPEVAATAAGNGRYTVAGVPLMTTGPWALRVRFAGADLSLPFQVGG
jgi:hypothetical protein